MLRPTAAAMATAQWKPPITGIPTPGIAAGAAEGQGYDLNEILLLLFYYCARVGTPRAKFPRNRKE